MLDTPAAVRRAAMDLLARREHGRVELARKLRQRGACPELIDPVLERLSTEGLLSEQRYIESFIRSRAQAGHGPLRIREELAQRGLPRDAIELALDESGFDWPTELQALWRRKFGYPPGDARERGRQGRFLTYRGYPTDMVMRLLRQASASG